MVELNGVRAFMWVCVWYKKLLTVFCSSLGFSFGYSGRPGCGVYVVCNMKHV
jgi:hypothetical protein